MSVHRVLGNGTTAFWKKVGIVCGGLIALFTVGTMVWKGASFGAAWGWSYANRQNTHALNQIVDRLTALQVRDSLTDIRLTRLEKPRRAKHS